MRHDERHSRERWRSVATVRRFNDFRRIAKRYDKLARNDTSAVALDASQAFGCDSLPDVRSRPQTKFKYNFNFLIYIKVKLQQK
jgi:hypothetical protein